MASFALASLLDDGSFSVRQPDTLPPPPSPKTIPAPPPEVPECPPTEPVLPEDDDPEPDQDCTACLGTGMRVVTAGSHFAPVETKPCFCGARP